MVSKIPKMEMRRLECPEKTIKIQRSKKYLLILGRDHFRKNTIPWRKGKISDWRSPRGDMTITSPL